MPNGKAAEDENAAAGGCPHAGISGHDRTLGDQVFHGLFYLRQHISVRLGFA